MTQQEIQDLDARIKAINYGPLTQNQRNVLVNNSQRVQLATILYYVLRGDITLNDMPRLTPQQRADIQQYINSRPDPTEQEEWNKIKTVEANTNYFDIKAIKVLKDLIDVYILRWQNVLNSHVGDARGLKGRIEGAMQKWYTTTEETAWAGLDKSNKPDLDRHLKTYPQSKHVGEIDDLYWGLTNEEDKSDLQAYMGAFPTGQHAKEAQAFLNAIDEWINARDSSDVIVMADYLEKNPYTPYHQKAQSAMQDWKIKEIDRMKVEGSNYPLNRFLDLYRRRIVSDQELIKEGIVTEGVLEALINPSRGKQLPNIVIAQKQSKPNDEPGYTDVYFFGVPSTGKTCVLMGLTGSTHINVDTAKASGPYAQALEGYLAQGALVPATQGNFVAMIDGTITPPDQPSGKKASIVYKVNLVDMSGEDFALKIAQNVNAEVNFADMGTGVTEQLQNENDKVFFIVIDPTQTIIKIDHVTNNGIQSAFVAQNLIVKRFVDIFKQKGNEEIMKRVRSIHFIMTKADLLGSNLNAQQEEAMKRFKGNYEKNVATLVGLGHGINYATKNRPKLYTFSLGKFYVGGIYEYNVDDANRIALAICNSTNATREKKPLHEVKNVLNKPII